MKIENIEKTSKQHTKSMKRKPHSQDDTYDIGLFEDQILVAAQLAIEGNDSQLKSSSEPATSIVPMPTRKCDEYDHLGYDIDPQQLTLFDLQTCRYFANVDGLPTSENKNICGKEYGVDSSSGNSLKENGGNQPLGLSAPYDSHINSTRNVTKNLNGNTNSELEPGLKIHDLELLRLENLRLKERVEVSEGESKILRESSRFSKFEVDRLVTENVRISIGHSSKIREVTSEFGKVREGIESVLRVREGEIERLKIELAKKRITSKEGDKNGGFGNGGFGGSGMRSARKQRDDSFSQYSQAYSQPESQLPAADSPLINQVYPAEENVRRDVKFDRRDVYLEFLRCISTDKHGQCVPSLIANIVHLCGSRRSEGRFRCILDLVCKMVDGTPIQNQIYVCHVLKMLVVYDFNYTTRGYTEDVSLMILNSDCKYCFIIGLLEFIKRVSKNVFIEIRESSGDVIEVCNMMTEILRGCLTNDIIDCEKIMSFVDIKSIISCIQDTNFSQDENVACLKLLAVLLTDPGLLAMVVNDKFGLVDLLLKCYQIKSPSVMKHVCRIMRHHVLDPALRESETAFKKQLSTEQNIILIVHQLHRLLRKMGSSAGCLAEENFSVLVLVLHELFLTYGDVVIPKTFTKMLLVAVVITVPDYPQLYKYADLEKCIGDFKSWIVDD